MHPFTEQLRRIPFVRLAIALMAGIVWQMSAWNFEFSTLFFAIGFAIIFFALFFIPSANTYVRQWISGAVGLACVFFIGTTITQQQPKQTSLPLGEEIWLQAEIYDAPLQYPTYIKLQAKVKTYAIASDTISVNEKIILYVAADSTTKVPKVGETIYTKANLSVIPPPANPDEFNYQQFLARRKIFASSFIRQGDYMIRDNQNFWSKLKYQPIEWQHSGLRTFADSPLGEKEYAVMVALTLGNKQFLDDEIRTSYVSVGAMHILAVSGLHVGIIMAILSFALSFLSKRRRGIILKNCLIIFFLWLYAAVVGFSPSVMRATVMFSFVLAGHTMQRRISTYNSIAASAFFLCMFNPLVVFDAGFELSYCAVLSIVYFQPYFSKWLYVKNKFLNYIWQLATVSVAAQIGTLPISLMNFHMFPNYFLLTNICIIALAGFITYGGALYLAVHAVPVLSTVVGYVLHSMLWLLNSIVRFIEALPHSVTKNIYLYDWQVLLMVVIIFLLALYFAFPRRLWTWVAAFSLVFLIGGFSLQSLEQRNQKMVAIYKVKNASYIQFVNGANVFSLRDEANSAANFSFNIDNFQIKNGMAARNQSFEIGAVQGDTIINGALCYQGLIIFENQIYKILENETISKRLPPMPTDYLLVTGRARMNPELALNRYFPKQIIIDNSVPVYRANQWIAAAEEYGIAIHNVRDQGAWINILQ